MREPIAEIFEGANLLRQAVDAHNAGDHETAASYFKEANRDEIRAWTESLWGSNSEQFLSLRPELRRHPVLAKTERVVKRMPNAEEQRFILKRDGFHCRFCVIPVIHKRIREKVRRTYPVAVPWGKTNVSQHAAFQAMWLQFDHLIPHSAGGTNSIDNVIITCAPCNYGKQDHTIEELGLRDPFSREPSNSDWIGLENF